MTIKELKEIVKDATQQAFDGQRISPDEEGMTWDIIASERLWFRTLLDSVEVEPIKHGRWEFIGGYGYQYRCSECINCAERKTKFCPNCGARMNKVEE